MKDKITQFFKKFKEVFKNFWTIFKAYIKNPLSSYKRVLISLSIIFGAIALIVIIVSKALGGFFNLFTDDIAQYYPFMAGFIQKLKAGEVSVYNNSFFAGASEFANGYYIPLDIFTFMTLILSYIFKTEFAYSIVNLLKVGMGGLLFAHVLKKQGFKNMTVFYTSLIFSLGGVLATTCVFPVYLSLIFYVPLGVYVMDRFRENKKYFFMIPIYVLVIILYDFYIAYMLLAFIMIYMLMIGYAKDEFSIIGKKSFYKNKRFYYLMFGSLGLIFVGLFMSLAIFLPNYCYITDKTTREVVYETLHKYNIKHYLAIISTYFTTSNPITILIGSGDYKRNHASMFITLQGLIYLFQFFALKGKENNRIKVFVILFNVLMCIPLVSMIMTGTSESYIRWFFIVYFINLYASAKAMDAKDMKYNEGIASKVISAFVLLLSLTIVLILFLKKNQFTMYDNSEFYWPVLIIFLVFNLLYLIFIFIKKGYKATRIFMVLELIASATIVYVNVGGTSNYYTSSSDHVHDAVDKLKQHSSYTSTNAYNAAMMTYETAWLNNPALLAGKVNTPQFFHSFYDCTINDFYSYYYNEYTLSWSKRENFTYYLPFQVLTGTKYLISYHYQYLEMPKYFTKVHEDGYYQYFELNDLKPFIIYDEFLNTKHSDPVTQTAIMMQYGSFGSAFETQEIFEDYCKYMNLKIVDFQEASNAIKNVSVKRSIGTTSTLVDVDGTTYFKADLSSYEFPKDHSTLVFYVKSQTYRGGAYSNAYVLDTDGNKHQLFYGMVGYNGTWTPKEIYFSAYDNTAHNMLVYSLGDDFYYDYLAKQNQYQNQYFELDNGKMTIKCDYQASKYNRILKTNYCYSDEWKVSNPNYKTINILGGWLGIVLPAGSTSCDITLSFEPTGLNLGLTIGSFTFGAFSVICGAIFISNINKKNYLF